MVMSQVISFFESSLCYFEQGKGLVRQKIEGLRFRVTRCFHIPQNGFTGRMVAEERDKAEPTFFCAR